MKNNPFKFGMIVDGRYFIDREKEREEISSLLKSENHLILTGPRRYGKSSLIRKVINDLDRPSVIIDLQLANSTSDLASMLLKRSYMIFPGQRMKMALRHFRIIPSITINPVSNMAEFSFQPVTDHRPILEDSLNLIEKLSNAENKVVVVFDEFQEAERIDSSLMRQLRSIMQEHKKINYILTGSQESLMRDIFSNKKSPFYHFGMIMRLGKIPADEFNRFICSGFKGYVQDEVSVADNILSVTQCHPYYTQQLAFTAWELGKAEKNSKRLINDATNRLIQMHDMDYERLWTNMNRTDRKLLTGLALSQLQPLSDEFRITYDMGATSTTFSCLKRLMISGLLNKTEKGYEIDDPFFIAWIRKRRA